MFAELSKRSSKFLDHHEIPKKIKMRSIDNILITYTFPSASTIVDLRKKIAETNQCDIQDVQIMQLGKILNNCDNILWNSTAVYIILTKDIHKQPEPKKVLSDEKNNELDLRASNHRLMELRDQRDFILQREIELNRNINNRRRHALDDELNARVGFQPTWQSHVCEAIEPSRNVQNLQENLQINRNPLIQRQQRNLQISERLFGEQKDLENPIYNKNTVPGFYDEDGHIFLYTNIYYITASLKAAGKINEVMKELNINEETAMPDNIRELKGIEKVMNIFEWKYDDVIFIINKLNLHILPIEKEDYEKLKMLIDDMYIDPLIAINTYYMFGKNIDMTFNHIIEEKN
jgi:hypothetical protein